MSLLGKWFTPPPAIKEIEDPELIQTNYRYWRWRIFYSMFIGYAFFYFTRKSFTFAMPAMISELGMTKAQLGMLASVFAITYGISKFVSGVMADRSNARYFMAFGLILTGLCNLFFGFSSSLFFFALFWGLNGWFQGFGWPPCARYLTHWYSQNERGRWWSYWNISHNIGAALIPILAAYCATYWGWRSALYVPAMLSIGIGFFLINRLRDTPQSLGLPPIEVFRNDAPAKQALNNKEHELTVKEILFTYVLTNPFVWVLATANFFVYIVRIGINDWTPIFLIETRGYTKMEAGLCVSLFEWGGLVGSLVAGWMSDRIFKSKRNPVNAIFSVGIIFSLLLFWMAPSNFYIDCASVALIGFWIFGPQMLIGVAAAELAHKKAAATASGLTGLWGYLGAAAAGYPLGAICEHYGWSGFFWALSACAIVSALLLIPLWPVNTNRFAERHVITDEEAPNKEGKPQPA